ncbi:MAG: nuclear transport factor 2 family protein [Mycobacteriales bacterium]
MAAGPGTITRLYAALAAGDGAGMAGCYAPDARFADPAFGQLTETEIGAMWRMLTSRSAGLRVDLRSSQTTSETGSAHWVATYRFGPKQRPVVNDVRASFRFGADGQITEHVDAFDLARWGAQAMGPAAGVLGRTPLLGLMVRRSARRQLDTYMKGAQ